MTRETDVDVAIVGARCGGSALARLLAAEGVRVVVIDRATFPSDTQSTHSISAHGSLLLQRWGLLDRVRATGVPNPRVMGVRVGAVDLPEVQSFSEELGSLAPRRTVLDALLVDAAREAGAQVWEGTTMRDVVVEDGRISGLRCDTPAGEMLVRAAVVVGADGSHSSVARAVGADAYDVRPSNLGGVYAYFAHSGLTHNELGITAGNVSLAFVTNDDLVCVAVGTYDSQARDLAAGGDDAFMRIVATASPRTADALGHARRATRFSLYRAQPGRFMTPYGPGWALVGDAGHYKDPFSGQGIADAFLSAQLLSDALRAGLGGERPLDDALSDFHRVRDECAADMHDITAQLSSMAWTDEEVVGLFLRYKDAVVATDERVRGLGAPRPLTSQVTR